MTKTLPYTFSCSLSWGGDVPTAELDVECAYSVAWGSPESGRFSGPPEDYDPGSPDEVDEIKILKVDGKPWPVDLSYGFQTEAQDHEMLVDKIMSHHDEDMIIAAVETEADRASDAEEAKFERMREDRRECDAWSAAAQDFDQ